MKYIQKSEVDGSQEKSHKRDRQRVFFTAVDPMDNGQSIEGISVRLGQAKDRTIDQYFRTSSKDGKCTVSSWLRREDCNFIKHDQTKSFSTIHNLRFVLRKRYA